MGLDDDNVVCIKCKWILDVMYSSSVECIAMAGPRRLKSLVYVPSSGTLYSRVGLMIVEHAPILFHFLLLSFVFLLYFRLVFRMPFSSLTMAGSKSMEQSF